MGRNKFFRQKLLTPAEQACSLKVKFPSFRILSMRNHLRCVGTLKPTPASDTYTVEIAYSVPKRPRVRVLRPELRLAAGRSKLPHVFEGNELCLHVAGDWRADQQIAEFIVPWISLWLAFYEFWVLTGEWLGGGHEPAPGAK
jgi:hypothetical protein